MLARAWRFESSSGQPTASNRSGFLCLDDFNYIFSRRTPEEDEEPPEKAPSGSEEEPPRMAAKANEGGPEGDFRMKSTRGFESSSGQT